MGQATIDSAPPGAPKAGLTTADREELVRLRRQLRQVQMERDILAKAMAWFAVRGEKTPGGSTNS